MGIAKAKGNGNEINLLAEYKALHTGSTLTAATAFEDTDFMRFALQRIAETKKYLKRYATAYNNHEHVTFAAEPNAILLTKFAMAAKFGVRANTYNEQLLGIGDYDEVATWQAAVTTPNTDPYNFATASTISLSKGASVEAGVGEDATTITGVVGVIYDRFAMGITIDKRKTTSQYSASRDTVNYFYHALANYVVNDNYPIVSFVVRD